MHAHAEHETRIGGLAAVRFDHGLLKLDGCTQRIDGAGELISAPSPVSLTKRPIYLARIGSRRSGTIPTQARQCANSRHAPSGGSSQQRLRQGSPPVYAAHGPRELPPFLLRIVGRPRPARQSNGKWAGSGRLEPTVGAFWLTPANHFERGPTEVSASLAGSTSALGRGCVRTRLWRRGGRSAQGLVSISASGISGPIRPGSPRSGTGRRAWRSHASDCRPERGGSSPFGPCRGFGS